MDVMNWTYIFGGVAVFGLIVGVFSVWNGRMRQREVGALIDRSAKDTQAILVRIEEHMKQMDERHTQFLERITEKVAHL